MVQLRGCCSRGLDVSEAQDRNLKLIAEIRAEVRETATYLGKDALDERVLMAMARVPRAAFVPAGERDIAYFNTTLPIGYRQTISQPYVVAVMTDMLGIAAGDVILEIGTGSGYQAAVLAELAHRVYSMETIQPLAEAADRRLKRLGYDNVEVRWGDGHLGWPEHAPYDGIIVTAAAATVPPALLAQLRVGGHLVIPVGDQNATQMLTLIQKRGDGTAALFEVLPVAFVPLTGDDVAGDQVG